MSKPIVQIKRGQAQELGESVRFTQPLLSGELCDIYYAGNNVHKLFIGKGDTDPSLLNPDYMFRIAHVNNDEEEPAGFKTQITLYRETRNKETGKIVYAIQSDGGFTIPPAGANVAFGLITNGNQIIAGDKTFSNTTASSSTTTGAVIIKGGVGIGGNIHVGGSSVFGGDLTINNSNLIVNDGEIKIGGSSVFGGDLTIDKSNLIVNDGEIKIGTSTEYCTLSYNADTDTLTILFPE